MLFVKSAAAAKIIKCLSHVVQHLAVNAFADEKTLGNSTIVGSDVIFALVLKAGEISDINIIARKLIHAEMCHFSCKHAVSVYIVKCKILCLRC